MHMNPACVRVTYTDNTTESRVYEIRDGLLTVTQHDFEKPVASIDISCCEFTAQTKDAGYFIVPNISRITDNQHAAQIFFHERENMQHIFTASTLPIYAVCDGKKSVLAICEGMQHEYELVAEVLDGCYRLFPRFQLSDVGFYEDIVIRFFTIEDNDWCSIARRYRKYQLDRGACRTLRERVKTNDVLKRAVKGIEIRCRLAIKKGWPNVPREQTLETEPDLEVLASFSRMENVLDALKESGCANAHFCLVGWNIGGMDGRDPDYFPVEPRLGGEAALRSLIKKAKNLGYLIGAHTNPMISFTISELLDRNDYLYDRDGSNYIWGVALGGNCHVLCDKQSYEHYVKDSQEKLKELGFCGINYFDQVTIFKPRTCYHPDHPLNKKEVVEYRKKILECGRNAVGCVASEGGYDYCIDSYDYAMYPAMTHPPHLPEICDNSIPFWYLVYHGIVLYNAFARTVNAMLKGPDYELLGVEYGARPLAYLHGRVFEYEGEPNFTCTTDEELLSNAKLIGSAYQRYDELSDLQYEFFDEYKILEKGVIYTRYSNGSVIIINYNDTAYLYDGKTVSAKSYLRID